MSASSNQCRAVGVLAGTFIPERRLMVALDGTSYKAKALPSLERRLQKNPEVLAEATHHVVYPRTTREGLEFVVVRSVGPSDPERYASLKREEGQFTIAGVVTNQRSRHNRVVVRVVRADAAPTGRKRQAEFRPHLLFLAGRVAPAGDFTNAFATFTCTIDAGTLRIRRVESRQRIEVQRMAAGGVDFPWPFHASKASFEALKRFNAKDLGPFLVTPPVTKALDTGLQKLEALISVRKSRQESPEENLTTDRLCLLSRRISNYTQRMGAFELEDLLEAFGPHVILNRIQPNAEAVAVAVAAPAAEPESAPEPLPESPLTGVDDQWVKLAGLLLEGLPDTILRDELDVQTLRKGCAALANSGWFDDLGEAEQKLARRSYQFKKALGRRG